MTGTNEDENTNNQNHNKSQAYAKAEELAYKNGWRISEDGKIITPDGRNIRGWISSQGYVHFRWNKHKPRCSAHRLQAYQKFGDAIYGMHIDVRHLDGNPLNNCLSNIAIGTQHENMMDRDPAERMAHAMHAASFWRKYDREMVRSFYDQCHSYKLTTKRFGMSSKGTLYFILKGRAKKQSNASS